MTTEKTDDDVLATAKKRYEYGLERHSHNRDKAKADLRFFAATPDDPWQWETTALTQRKDAGRPTLTINKLPQHVRQVTNDIRQNRPSIKYRPADSKADVKVADILMGIVRHIESNSDADVAYDACAEPQVQHGTGYIRVLADYISETSFDQDIFIRPVEDPFKVTDDPDAMDPAGADRKWLFIEDNPTEDEFKREHPNAEPIDWDFDGKSSPGWFDRGQKTVRICEYYEVCHREKALILWDNGETSFEGDPQPPGALGPALDAQGKPKTRKTQQRYVMWRKINGTQILEEKEFPSKYIPFARAMGNYAIIDGKMYVWGLVRPAKDSQRAYNVGQSAIYERVMMAPKAPYLIAADAVDGHEKHWQNANVGNPSFLPWNHKDDENNPIPPPQRIQPATVEPGLMQIVQSAADDIKSETGQYDASLGAKSNETSGKAIMARQREGDIATFHYVDNLAKAVRHVGRIILDMIPRIYDTRRIARILGEDGSPSNATLDPSLPEPRQEVKRDDGEIEQIFNPNVGTYDVYTTTGPSFTSRRQEAVEAMSQMTQANPQLWQVIGDLLVKNMDWPGAEDMAKRLRMVLLPEVAEAAKEDGQQLPPEALQAIQQMQAQMEQMQQAGAQLQMQLQEAEKAKDSEAAGRIKAEIKALEVQSLMRIRDAEEQMMKALEAERANAQPVEPAPAAPPPAPINVVTGGENLAPVLMETLTPVMATVAQVAQTTEQLAATVSQGQQALLQTVMEGQQRTELALAEAMKPRTTQIDIKRVGSGFVATKVEV
jgi:hypothetical protein